MARSVALVVTFEVADETTDAELDDVYGAVMAQVSEAGVPTAHVSVTLATNDGVRRN